PSTPASWTPTCTGPQTPTPTRRRCAAPATSPSPSSGWSSPRSPRPGWWRRSHDHARRPAAAARRGARRAPRAAPRRGAALRGRPGRAVGGAHHGGGARRPPRPRRPAGGEQQPDHPRHPPRQPCRRRRGRGAALGAPGAELGGDRRRGDPAPRAAAAPRGRAAASPRGPHRAGHRPPPRAPAGLAARARGRRRARDPPRPRPAGPVLVRERGDRDRARRVIAVGTTVVRALETAAGGPRRVRPVQGWTRLAITPEHRMRAVDALLTGLHEPGVSHLDIVGAAVALPLLERAHAEMLERGYLWHEFGDSLLVL